MLLKGKLVIIGGAEDKGTDDNRDEFTENGILERVIEESAHKKQSRIEIVTTASTVPEEVGADYIRAFKKLGVENVGILNIESRDEADSARSLKRLKSADVVFFSGGDQIRLTSILGGTDFFSLLNERLHTDKNFIYAGTSAGAAAASESMILSGNSEQAITKGAVKTATGFGFVENIIFDTHFVKRGRIGRLFEIVLTNPKTLGVGIEENTGLLIIGNKMEAIGPGMTILIDGRDIRQTNLLDIREGAPLSIDSLCLKVMSKTDIFDLKARSLEIITPDECRI